jgi:hypothetical protein
MSTSPVDPYGGRAGGEPDGFDEVQAAVDRLAARLDLSVLVEDRQERPVWWSTRGAVDGTRVRTILNRRVDRDVARAVRTFDLARAVEPVRTPGIPELDMWARWCMPVHAGTELLGLLWVLDPDDRVRPEDLPLIVTCADRAAEVLARTERSRRDATRRRDELLTVLLAGPDQAAATELASLEHLPPEARVQVDQASRRSGWTLPDDLRAHLVRDQRHTALSGAPLPLVRLAESVRRATATRTALRAGARLDRESWDTLGAWRLVVDAPHDLAVDEVHPAAETLAALPRTDLVLTARTVLDLGGDVAAAAQRLHVHRTTLYHRLDRIADLTGVDLRDGSTRTDLQLALWLAAYRAAS